MLALTIGLMAGGCAAHPAAPPFVIQMVKTATTHYAGTPLSGPQAGAAVSYQGALDVHIRWFSLETFDSHGLPLVASQARLVTQTLASQAVLASPDLLASARIGWFDNVDAVRQLTLSNPGRYFEIGQDRAVLPDGVTASFRAVETGGLADQTLGLPQPRYVEVNVARISGNTLQIALGVEDYSTQSPSDQNSTVYQHEIAIVEHPLGNKPATFLVIVPFNLLGPPNQAVAAWVTVGPAGNDPAFAGLVTQCQADLAAGGSSPTPPTWALGLTRSMDGLDDPRRRRAALVYMSGQVNAGLCQDTAMLASDDLLTQLSAAVKKDGPAALSAGDASAFAWVLDRSAITVMQPLLEKATLPDELFAVLTEYMGEAGRHASDLDEVMGGSTSMQTFQDKLVAENYISLEDGAPSARVRAFNWLKAHNVAPAGFDPLGNPRDRRKALDKALANAAVGGQP